MSKPEQSPHSIFRSSSDYHSWDKYLEQLDLIELSSVDNKGAKDALISLRSFFGENFLKRCFQKGHPLRSDFANSAPIARLQLTRLAECIHFAERCPGFDQVAKRLKRPRDYAEAATVLETAADFGHAGFDITFEPKVSVTSISGRITTKKPDLILSSPDTDEKVIVEVSRLRKSAAQVKSSSTFDTIWSAIHQVMQESSLIELDHENNTHVFRHILPYADILQDLVEGELVQIVEDITTLAEKVRTTNQFQELLIPNKIEVAISPIDDHSRATRWAQDRGLEDLIRGPALPLHETHRTRIKIGDKITQLPVSLPGIIVIPTTETLMFFTHGIAEIIDDIGSEILRYPQLICIILISHTGEAGVGPPQVIRVGDHNVVARLRQDGVTERKIMISNPAFTLPIAKSTADLINQSLFGW
jgi:hypothetical protein